MAMAEVQERFLPVMRRYDGGRERPIAVRHAQLADDFGLADGPRPGLVTRRRTIT